MSIYSVLMSVYEKEQPAFLKESIDSILRQTLPTDNFIIVCDGPLTAELEDILQQFLKKTDAIQLVRLEQNAGLGNALNEGMKHCQHDMIARMDSDDIAFPERCERQVAAMIEQNADILSGPILEFEGDYKGVVTRKPLPQSLDKIRKYARRRCPFNHPCVMFRKQAVLAAGGYQDFYRFEDYYLWIRMLQNGAKAYNMKQPLLYMRGGSNMYARRGGWSYLRAARRFRKWMYHSGFSSWSDYMISITGQAIVCLLPNSLRMVVYKTLLRH